MRWSQHGLCNVGSPPHNRRGPPQLGRCPGVLALTRRFGGVRGSGGEECWVLEVCRFGGRRVSHRELAGIGLVSAHPRFLRCGSRGSLRWTTMRSGVDPAFPRCAVCHRPREASYMHTDFRPEGRRKRSVGTNCEALFWSGYEDRNAHTNTCL